MSVASESSTAHPAPVVNLTGYRFVRLDNLPLKQHDLLADLDATGIKGTVLLAEEGINVALAGTAEQALAARHCLDAHPEFRDLWLKQSYSEQLPFAKLKVRQRREIISFLPAVDRAEANSAEADGGTPAPAPTLPPATLRQWLDAGHNFTLLDTRNRYEVESGSFAQATDLDIDTFREFGSAVRRAVATGELRTDQPVVTFCTGGVRCEKAAPWLLENGFREVYQVEGGIVNYFEQCGAAHWTGHCFVFDDRVQLDTALRPTGAHLCPQCHHAVPQGQTCSCQASTTAMDTV